MKWENNGRSRDIIDERSVPPPKKPPFRLKDLFRWPSTDERGARREDPGTSIVVVGDDPDTPGGIPPPSERKRWVSEAVDIPPEKSRLRDALGATPKKWAERNEALEWIDRQEERKRYPAGEAGDIAKALKPHKRNWKDDAKKPRDL